VDLHKNLARWTLPLDEYEAPPTVMADYAQNLLISRCMQAKGYDWPVPPLNTAASGSVSFNAAGHRLFDVPIAQTYGYHLAPDPRLAGAEATLNKLNSTPLTGKKHTVFLSCVRLERRQLPRPSMNIVESDGAVAYESAIAQPAVLASERRWYSCMSKFGTANLPRSPLAMPTTGFKRQFGWSGRHADTAGTVEIRVAVHDAKCRESSGFAQAFYDAEWDQELRLIAGNETALSALGSANRTFSHRMAQVIARYDS
jgi:hypothetical protein